MTENIYYHPEKFDLREYGQLDLAGDYEFCKFVVWVGAEYDPTHSSGLTLPVTVYWAWDSGCSCPVPFEGHGWNDLRRGTAQQCMLNLQQWYAGQPEFRKNQNAYLAFLERLVRL